MSSSEEDEELSAYESSDDAVVQDPDAFDELPKSKLRAQQPLDVTYDPAYQGRTVTRGDAGLADEADSSDWSDDGSLGGGSSTDGEEEGGAGGSVLGGGGVGGGEDGGEDAKRLQEEFAALEQAEAVVVKDVAPDSSANVEKAGHIRAQFSLWDALVEARIRMQPALALANRLPQRDTFAKFKAGTASDRKRAHSAVAQTVSKLLGLQQALFKQSSIISADDDGDDENDDDGENEGLPPKKKKKKAGGSSSAAVIAPAKDAAAAYQKHDEHHNAMSQYTKETLEKWFTKTNLSRTKTNTKKFRALDRSVMKQVEQVMSDKARWLQRTQLKRLPFKVIGKAADDPNQKGGIGIGSSKNKNGRPESSDDSSDDDETTPMPKAAMGGVAQGYDAEIFDDGDHYQDILRELIERKATATDATDPVAMGRHWVELSKLRSKVKRKVDTRASKGRKIRYHVHEKLVNFMAPDPNLHPSSDQAKDDLFSSLFQ